MRVPVAGTVRDLLIAAWLAFSAVWIVVHPHFIGTGDFAVCARWVFVAVVGTLAVVFAAGPVGRGVRLLRGAS